MTIGLEHARLKGQHHALAEFAILDLDVTNPLSQWRFAVKVFEFEPFVGRAVLPKVDRHDYLVSTLREVDSPPPSVTTADCLVVG